MSLLSGSKALSQKQVPVSEGALAIMKGESDKKDSLLQISNGIIMSYEKTIISYEKVISNLNKQIKINTEQCLLQSSSVSLENTILLADVKTLKKSRNLWRNLAITIPTVVIGSVTYFLIK